MNTGTAGKQTIQYTAPQAAGITDITLKCTLPSGVACDPYEDFINVGVTGLARLGAGVDYGLVGQTANHPENHFGTPGLLAALKKLAASYRAAFPDSKLLFNDMSMFQGGLFDCFPCKGERNIPGVPWKTPHKGHRTGKNADLSYRTVGLDVARRKTLENWIEKANELSIYPHSDHWHLTVLK